MSSQKVAINNAYNTKYCST